MASSSALSKTDTDEVPLRKPTKLRQLKERSISLVMSDLDIKEAWTQLNSEKQHSSSSCTTSPETGTRPQQSSADKPFRKSTGSDNTPTSYRSSKRKSCKTYSESPKRSSKKLRHSTNTSLSPTIAPSSPTQGAVWKKNANADEVRSALVKVMEMQESSSSRNFIPITPPLNIKRAKTEETKEDEPLTDRRVKKRAATSKIMKLSTRRLKTLSFNETNIVRGNRDESLPMMTHLEEEFKQFSKISFSRSDESLTPRTRSRLEEKPDKRTQIIIEIRASERSYVNQLTLVVEKYLTPAEALKANGGAPKFSVDEIFSNIKEIQIVHKSFLEQLDSKLEEWSASETIGDLFIQLIPELYIYNTYGKTYDASLLAIAQASKDSKFVHFLDRCHESTNTSLNLESLLIAPIQRIPRYILLLSDLQQQTPTDHPDYEAVGEAVKAFQQAAAEMNENIKKAKQRSTFEELTVSLKDLKAQDRLLIHECVIRCEKRRTNIAIFIFNDLFIHMSEGKAKSKSNLVFKRYHWPLNLMWIKDCKNEFTKIMGPDGFYKFRKCDTIAWESSLHKAITEHLALIKTPVKMDADSPLRYGTYTFLNNNATFTGIWKNGKVKKGTYSHLGTVYDGEFVMGKKGGVGKQNTFFQSCYIGKWENGRPNGKGVITDSAGNEYSGYFENGMKHGQGVIHYVTGEVYEGSWVKDYPEGVGTMIFPTGTTYAGNFENGRFHYYGVLKKEGSPTSYTYEGLWSHGIKEGTGRMISPGFTYDGEWKADLQEGIGKSIDHLGSYRGHWVAGVKEGQGTFTYISGTVYSGSWKRNLYHGTGKLTCKEGVFMSYEGEWHSGRKCGKGIMHFRNYDVYEGLFKDDIMHGAGVYTFAMGSIIEGKWNRGRLDGKVTFTRVKDNTKKVYTTTCKDNLLSLQDFPDSPIELNFQLPTLQCWHY